MVVKHGLYLQHTRLYGPMLYMQTLCMMRVGWSCNTLDHRVRRQHKTPCSWLIAVVESISVAAITGINFDEKVGLKLIIAP
jgi:hypothetical protein